MTFGVLLGRKTLKPGSRKFFWQISCLSWKYAGSTVRMIERGRRNQNLAFCLALDMRYGLGIRKSDICIMV